MRRFLFLVMLLQTSFFSFAQEVAQCLGIATVTCPTEWEKYREFYYEITIPAQSDFSSCVYPDFGFIDDVFGPMKSSTHTIEYINGERSEEDLVTYKWKLIAKKEVGELVIPSFKISSKDAQNYFIVPETKVIIHNRLPVADDIFIQWEVDGAYNCSVGEVVSCQLVLYSGSGCRISDFQMQPCPYAYIKNVSPSGEIEGKTTVFNHKLYSCYVLKKYNITPLMSGAVKLPEARVELKLLQPKSGQESDDIFDSFFNQEEIEKVCISQDVILKVDDKHLSNLDTLAIENTGIAVCVDVSSSMRSKDVGQNRLTSASKMIDRLQSNARFNSLARYMAFAESMELDWAQNLSQYLDTLQTPYEDGTSLFDALVYPIASLPSCKDVIVITDGIDNNSHIPAEMALNILKNYSIRPHVIYLNSLQDSVRFDYNFYGDVIERMVSNDKFDDEQLNDLKLSLQSLGGDLYLIKDEKDIRGTVKRLLKKATGYERDKVIDTVKSCRYEDNYVLKELRTDFYWNIYWRKLIDEENIGKSTPVEN